jgi:hypothetical protein
MLDVKFRLRRVIEDPHFGRRERQLAKSSLDRIEELEGRDIYHWTEVARMSLLKEIRDKVLDKPAAVMVDSFLKRHRIKRSS